MLGLAVALTAGCGVNFRETARREPAPAGMAAVGSASDATFDREAARVDILRDIFRSSVQIMLQRDGAPFRWGSGVIIGSRPSSAGTECLVLSAGHTLTRLTAGDEVYALLDRDQPQAVRARAELISVQDNDSWDLALLKIRNDSCIAARVGEPPSLGESIWVVGFPLGGDLTLGRGIVSQVARGKTGVPSRFTVDASTSHGSSGAGVFDARTGRLIGLVEAFGTARVPVRGDAASWNIDIPMPGMTYVTPVGRIDQFLRAAGEGVHLVGRQ